VNPLVIVGASNLLSDIYECAALNGYWVRAIVLNQEVVTGERALSLEARIATWPHQPAVLTADQFSPQAQDEFHMGTSSPGRSVTVPAFERLFGKPPVTLLHPSATVSRLSQLGEGVFVGAGCVIAPGAVLEKGSFLNRRATIGHDTRVGAFSRIQAGANVGGHTSVGEQATIGMGACVIEELVIGRRAFVAAGAVVIRDVAEGVLVAGVPAVVKRHLSA
jgi:sugar O-acyltransferase (sialic acid O-acetyltransferase NeuD family)